MFLFRPRQLGTSTRTFYDRVRFLPNSAIASVQAHIGSPSPLSVIAPTATESRTLVDHVSMRYPRPKHTHGNRSAACATAGQASTGDTQGEAAGGGNDISKGDAHEIVAVERLILRGNNLPLATTSVCARQLLVTGLISLDVSGTQLGDASLDKVAAWTPWLRELYVAGDGTPTGLVP